MTFESTKGPGATARGITGLWKETAARKGTARGRTRRSQAGSHFASLGRVQGKCSHLGLQAKPGRHGRASEASPNPGTRVAAACRTMPTKRPSQVGKLGCEQLLLDKRSVRQNLQKDIFVHGSQNSERHAAPLSGRVQSCVGGTVYRRLPSPPLPYLPTAPTHLPKDSSLICFHCFPFSPTAPPSSSLPAPSCLRRGTVID